MKKTKTGNLPQAEDTMALFARLAKPQPGQDNLDVARRILGHLRLAQATAALHPGNPEISTEASTELCYALGRLIKGSASLNAEIRTAFAATLSSVLVEFHPLVPVGSITKLVQKTLTAQDLFGASNPSRGEESAVLCAKLGCYSAVVVAYGAELAALHEAQAAALIQDLFLAARQRSYLGASAYQLLAHIYMLSDAKINELVWANLKEALCNADLVWFLLETGIPVDRCSIAVSARLPVSPILGNTAAVHALLLETISFLREPHRLWKLLLGHLHGTGQLAEWVATNIDAALFGSESVDKKLLGLKLIDEMVAGGLAHAPLNLPCFFELVNSVGPNVAKKAKASLPLNAPLLHTVPGTIRALTNDVV